MENNENLIPELEGVDLNTNENLIEQTLDLDEIMREFAEKDQSAPEETVAFEPVSEETMAFEPVETQEQAPVSDETVAFDPVSDETREFTPVTDEPLQTEGDTMSFTPVSEPEETVEEMDRKDRERLEELQQEPKEEPFSEQWEPEYEQPMGDYVPAPQILVHPRSRLKELKRKLIEGPEKRYYAISEVGFGKLYFAIFLCILAVLASVAISVLNALGMIPESRQKLLVFAQLFMMLFAALLGSNQLLDGLTGGRFNLNSLLVITFGVCTLDAVMCLNNLRVPCCAAFSLQMLMSLWSESQRRSAEMGMMDTMRKAVRLDKLAAKKELYNGKTGFLRGEGQVEDVMDTYTAPAGPERFQSWCALGALVVSLALAAFAFIRAGMDTAIQVLSVSLLAGVPAAAFIAVSRPMAILEKRLHKLGAVLCGWQGVKALKEKAVFPVDHNDLFPGGTVKMNGVKFFGSRETEQVVAYGTALVSADGGGLAPLFEQVLESRNGRHYDVENFRGYDNGGIGGEVCGEPVLVGLLPFLRDMGVEIPEGLRVDQAVCVAIDGELCGIFALSYERSNAVASALHTLCGCPGVKPLLTNTDFMLSGSFLRAKFGIRPKKVIIPDYEQIQQLKDQTLDEDAKALLLTTKEGIAPLAFGVTGARALHTAGWMGAVLQLFGGLVGLAVVALLVLKNGTSMLTPDNMFLFQLVWLIPAFLISEGTRTL